MEASALRAPAGLSRRSIAAPLLRLRSDDQLLALFRAGSTRRSTPSTTATASGCSPTCARCSPPQSRQDAEDVLQDVFVRAFGALRADDREVNVRAWLYRVAHNRCIDHLRRPIPAPADDLRDVAQAAARPDRGGPAPRGPAPPGDGRRPPARAAALGAADARDRRHVLRRPRRRARRHRARREVAARARAARARRGRRGARHRLRRDPRGPARRLRPRRQGLRPRPPPHAASATAAASTAPRCAACARSSPR